MTRLKLVAIGIGAVLAWLGYQEFKLGAVASETPQTITCAELEATGPGDNAHVVMGDFVLLEQAFVYESRENSSRWDKIWIPALPLEGEFYQELLSLADSEGNLPTDNLPLPKTIRVIVRSSKVHNEGQLATIAGADTLQGLITNEIESLGSEERKLLTESYPGIDFDAVWILEHERKPSGKGKTWGLLGGGTLLVLLGLGAFFINRD